MKNTHSFEGIQIILKNTNRGYSTEVLSTYAFLLKILINEITKKNKNWNFAIECLYSI